MADFAALMKRVRVATVMAEETRMPSQPVGDRLHVRRAQVRFEEHGHFAPPWRTRLRDGGLSPEYGPGDYAAAQRRWRESYAGGGLWDSDEDWRSRKREVPLDRVAYLEAHGHELAPHVLEVAWYRAQGHSVEATAKRCGLSKASVERAWSTFSNAWRDYNGRVANGRRWLTIDPALLEGLPP